MSLQKQQDFLARLFTDESLRRNFLSAPEKVGAENGLSETETGDLKMVLPEQLNFFADSLFGKRRREVEKLLPLTKDFLNEDFAELFREFSQNFNPQTVKKHLEDAIEFCKFLLKSNISDLSKNIAEFERTKLEFFGYEKRFAICRLNFDIKEISRQGAKAQNEIPRKKTIAVWIRFGKKFKHFTT